MDSIISFKNLAKHYGEIKAVDDISLDVERGEVFGFLGPNGAGKTTTIRLLLNIIFPTSGSASVFNLNPVKSSPEIMKRVGYVAGDVALFENYRVDKFLDYYEKLHGKESETRAELVERLNLDESRKIGELSSGNKQKVAIVQAFMNEPELLILDEPTSGLDPLLQNEFYKLVREYQDDGATVFFSSHILSEVEKVCDRICIIRDGKIVAIEKINELKEKSISSVEVSFKKGKEKFNFKLEGIDNIVKENSHTSFAYKGDINVLIKELSKYDLASIKINEPTLEELFLNYYEGEHN